MQREDGLRRPTFPNSWKSGQKSRKKPMISSLPCVLYAVQNRDCIPHVRASLSFSFCHRIVSASAPLPLIPTSKNALGSTVWRDVGSDPSAACGRYSGENGAALPVADIASRFQGSAPFSGHEGAHWTDGTTRANAVTKFWAPQQDHAALRKGSVNSVGADAYIGPCNKRTNSIISA